MKLIVFTDPNEYKHESVIIQRIIALTQHDVHLYKPHASEKTIAALLASLDDFSLAKIVLHHQKQLAAHFPVKGVHKSRVDGIVPRAISLSVHQLIEPKAISDVEYAFFSPVFSSLSKHHHKPVYPLKTINDWVAQTANDYYALSGLTIDRIKENDLSGFMGVAVLGAIWESQDPVACVRALLGCLKSKKSISNVSNN